MDQSVARAKEKPAAQTEPKKAEAGPATEAGARSQGAWTSYVKAVQAKGGKVAGADPVKTAQAGVQGAGDKLPHGDRIQAAFGQHDVSGVRAHTGGDAAKAGNKLGAEAFATGQDVAFQSSPDVHTAAHEAAHVVQQRAGVQLKGGTGKAGDALERNADAAADKVVRGESAEGVLDQVAGGVRAAAPAGGVQALHGNLETKASTENGAKEGQTVGEAAKELHPEARDQDFNPKERVQFEAELCAALSANQALFRGAVEKVSQGLLGYMQKREKLGIDAGVAKLEKDSALGRLMDPRDAARSVRALLGDAGGAAGPGTVQEIMGSQGRDVSLHLQVHGNFKDEVLAGDYEQHVTDELGNVAQAVAGKAQAGDQHFMRRKDEVSAYLDPNDPMKKDRDNNRRGRKTASDKTGKYLGNEGEGKAPGPFRGGMDVWIVNEGNKFVQEARLKWNMPIGAGISGTTTDLLEVAAIGGVTGGDELLQYLAAVMSFIVGNKHHSFHEVASAARAAGVNYSPGNYRGIYPKALEGTSDFKALAAKYPQYLGGPA